MKELDKIVEGLIEKIQKSCVVDQDYYGNVYSFDCVHRLIRREVWEFVKQGGCPNCGSGNIHEFRNDEGGYSLCMECGVMWSYPRLVHYMIHKIWETTTDERLRFCLNL